MRYGIRTLAVIITVLAALFARLGYSVRMAALHRDSAASAVRRLPIHTDEAPDVVADLLARHANCDSEFRVNPWGNPWDLETDDVARDLKDAVYHTAMANLHEHYLLAVV